MQIDANWIKFNQIHSKNNLSNFENQQNPGFWGAYPSFIWERSKTDPARKRVFRRWLLPLSMNKNLRFSNVSTCWSVTPAYQRSPKTPIFPNFASMARFLTKKLKMRRGSKPKIWTSKLTFYNPDREGAQKFLNLKFDLKTLEFELKSLKFELKTLKFQ